MEELEKRLANLEEESNELKKKLVYSFKTVFKNMNMLCLSIIIICIALIYDKLTERESETE